MLPADLHTFGWCFLASVVFVVVLVVIVVVLVVTVLPEILLFL